MFSSIKNTLLFSFLTMMILTNCKDQAEHDEHRRVFNYNEMAGITSLDPAMASNLEIIWPINLLFNGLVQMDDSLNVKPCIAKYWTISEDGLTYTFTLRNDVYFHDNACFKNEKGRKIKFQNYESE